MEKTVTNNSLTPNLVPQLLEQHRLARSTGPHDPDEMVPPSVSITEKSSRRCESFIPYAAARACKSSNREKLIILNRNLLK
jgi:hypothetical protein